MKRSVFCVMLLTVFSITWQAMGQRPQSVSERQGRTLRSSTKLLHSVAANRSEMQASRNAPNSDESLFLYGELFDTGGGYPYSVAVADVNGDGKPDLVVANCGTSTCDAKILGSVRVLLGRGDGTFEAAVTYSSGGRVAVWVTAGDINGDGKADLAVANQCADEACTKGSVAVFLGKGDGTFQPPAIYNPGSAISVTFADVNADGKPDLIVGNDGLGVMLGNGDGTFQAVVTYPSGGGWVQTADVNDDSKLDALTTNGDGVGVLLGRGDGTFSPVVNYGMGYYIRSAAVADVNGDGKSDLMAVDFLGYFALGVRFGNGDGTFGDLQIVNWAGYGPESIAATDVNADGRVDVLLETGGGIGVFLGNGDGTFQNPLNYGSGGRYGTHVAVADLNGDGKLDAAVTFLCSELYPECGNGAVGVFLNDSGFHSPTVTALASSANPAVPGQQVTYTVTVTSQYEGPVRGSVYFDDARHFLGSVPLVNHQASFTTSYAKVGARTITASYTGDADSEWSASQPLTEYVKILPVGSKTVVTTSGSPSAVGQPVTFTAKVTSPYGTIPDGELVAFYDGAKAMATVALSGGVATYTTGFATAKNHAIKAIFSGDTTFKPSTGHVWQLVTP